LTEFHRHGGNGSADGRNTSCKPCRNAKNEEWRETNPGKELAKNRLYKYDLTEWQFWELVRLQDGCCALCGHAFGYGRWGRDPVLDHDHSENRVRGVLHRNCNTGLGLLRECVDAALRIPEYLTRPSPTIPADPDLHGLYEI
jgi:hypothetical protein